MNRSSYQNHFDIGYIEKQLERFKNPATKRDAIGRLASHMGHGCRLGNTRSTAILDGADLEPGEVEIILDDAANWYRQQGAIAGLRGVIAPFLKGFTS
jgi:hypothetical protein